MDRSCFLVWPARCHAKQDGPYDDRLYEQLQRKKVLALAGILLALAASILAGASVAIKRILRCVTQRNSTFGMPIENVPMIDGFVPWGLAGRHSAE